MIATPSNWLYVDTHFPDLARKETTDEKIAAIQNYLYMLVEQLRYTLFNLDFSNINQVAAENYALSITTPVYARIKDNEGHITQLEITAESLTATISDTKTELMSQLQQTASGFELTVQNMKEDVYAQLNLTAEGLAARISNAEGSLTTISATAEELAARISNAEGSLTTISTTAEGLTARISNAEGSLTTINATAEELAARISNAEGSLTTISATAEELAARISNAEGSLTTISATAEELAARISNAEGNLTTISATARELAARISNAEGNLTAVTATAEGLAVRVSDTEGDIASLNTTAAGIQTQVTNLKDGISSTISQEIQKISLNVSNYKNGATSDIELTYNGISLGSQTIRMRGLVTMEDLEGSGTTVINGDNITTGTINAVDIDSCTLYGCEIWFGSMDNSRGFLASSYGDDGESDTRLIKLMSTGGLYIEANGGVRINSSGLWLDMDISRVNVRHNGWYETLASLLGL